MVARRTSSREDRGARRNDRDRDDRSERRTPSRSRDRDDDRDDDRGRGRGGRDRDDDRGGSRDRDRGGKKGSGFVYKPRDPDAVKKKMDRQGGNFDSIIKQGFDFYRVKNGDNTIRILPPTWDNHEDCAYTIWQHRFIGPDNSTYLCLRKMKNEHCPICVESKAAADAGDKEEAKAFRASEAVALWIIDRDDKTDPPLPQFYVMSFRQWQDILKVSYDKKNGKILDIDDPNRGFDLNLSRTGQGERTRYAGFAFDREASPIDEDAAVQDEILDFVEENPIPDVLNFYDADYIENVISGTAPEKDKDADAEDDRGRDRDDDRGSSRRGRGRDDDRDDDRDRDDKDNDKDDDDRGRGRGGRRGRDEPEDDDKDRDPPDDDKDAEEDRGDRRGRRGRDDPEEDKDPPPERRGSRGRGRASSEPEDEPEPEPRGRRAGRTSAKEGRESKRRTYRD